MGNGHNRRCGCVWQSVKGFIGDRRRNILPDSSTDNDLTLRIASGLLGEPTVGVAPLLGRGSVNKVFVVETSTRKVVVRMSDRGEAFDEYAKEAWCIEQAAARGVPVPSVLGSGRREGHSYIVLSYVDGDDGRESAAPRPCIWRELGRYARLIHSVRVHGFGLSLSEMTRGDARESWLRHLEYNIESLNEDDPLIRLGVLTRPQSKLAKGVFVSLRGREFTFGLNHGDLSLKNTVIDERGRVSLLDWGSAEAAAVPHHDLIQMLKMNMSEGDPDGEDIRAFLEGYGISPADFERMMPELEGLLVLRAFDKLRWAIERNVEGLEEYVDHAREAAGRCLPQC
jgi:aminoglycoside phosphotransferase (APT) family kinase protein